MSSSKVLDQEGMHLGDVSDVVLEPGEQQDVHAVFHAAAPLHARLTDFLQARTDIVLVHKGARYDLRLVDMLDEEFRGHGWPQEPQD